MFRLFSIAAIYLVLATTAFTKSDPYTSAWLKWDAGDYTGSLEEMIAILDGPDSGLYFADIARLTGELYRVDEIAVNGSNPVFSTDSRHFAWHESGGTGDIIHVARVIPEGFEHLHSIAGGDFRFSPDGKNGIFFRTVITPRMEELQQEFSEAREQRNFELMREIRNSQLYEQALNTTLYRFDLETGLEAEVPAGGLMVRNPIFGADGTLWFAGADPDRPQQSDIYMMKLSGQHPEKITAAAGYFDNPLPVPGTPMVLYTSSPVSTFPVAPGTERHRFDTALSVVLHHLQNNEIDRWAGQNPVLSRNGSRVAFLTASGGINRILSAEISDPAPAADTLVAVTDPIQNPALSPDGSRLAYMVRSGISWNINLVDTESGEHGRLTNDIQHELFPHFLDENRVLAMMGEARHRRSHIYDVHTKEFYRLMHNNTIRTVSMEYEWEPSADGNYLLVVAQRDGDTINPKRGLYLVRIGHKISKEDLRNRLENNLADERALHAKAHAMFEPIRDQVQAAVDDVNMSRMYRYQKAMYDFGSKHITQPGNRKAMEYIYETLKSFGYEPELQWFNPGPDIETANVIATLKGTTHPEVVYILSSHFDSMPLSPGADDNTSGTAVLLEAARVLAQNPQPATIIFASLTAEESGLLGAREFTRLAEETGLWAMGVINNDMMGWTRHHRLDNTIRYSNYGIRDIQHSASILFSDLITYDSRYYRNTDAHAFFDAFGDVIGGIGSYPILGNPNYHQPTDRLETINHNLLREVAKSAAASLMMLANAPSKVTGLEAVPQARNSLRISWNASPENDIDHYLVRYTGQNGDDITVQARNTNITVRDVAEDSPIAVKAVNSRGIEGWDWTVPD
jgi:Tol biopolymer transport system component